MESYEQKYKEALGWMKSLYGGLHGKTKEEAEKYFTELKESEDERVKKELIELISCMHDADPRKKGWIAWLEKQIDKDKLIKELGKYKVKYTQEILQNHLNSIINKDDERLRKTTIAFLKEFADKGYENAVECIDWLEKQGQQNFIEEKSPAESLGISPEKYEEIVNECIYGEENPADEVEPNLSNSAKIGMDEESKWTEEDEQYLLVCKNALHKYQWSDKWDADIISKWLEDKLKQRME